MLFAISRTLLINLCRCLQGLCCPFLSCQSRWKEIRDEMMKIAESILETKRFDAKDVE